MELTDIILHWLDNRNDKEIERQLYFHAYKQLKQIASQEKQRCQQKYAEQNFVLDDLLQNTTALANDAYLKLAKIQDLDIKTRKDFYSLIADMVRQVLIDQSRYYNAQKRQAVPFSDSERNIEELIMLDHTFEQFSQRYPVQSEIMKFKYLMGLSIKEISQLVQCSTSKVEKDLKFSRAWLTKDQV